MAGQGSQPTCEHKKAPAIWGLCAPHWKIIEPIQGRLAITLQTKTIASEEICSCVFMIF